MPSGYYKDSKPDPGWWMDQITAGEDFRKKYAHEEKWPSWRAMYRGNWDKGKVLPQNLFFSTIRSLVPRVYFRNPRVSVSPRRPGFDEMAFAQVMHRIDNSILDYIDLKGELKMAVQDAVLFGTAFIKVGYGGLFANDLPFFVDTNQEMPYHGRQGLASYMPWAMRMHPGKVIVPDQLDSIRNSRWIATRDTYPLDHLKQDERLKKIEFSASTETTKTGGKIETVDLIEIRDLLEGKWLVIAPNNKDDRRVVGSGRDYLSEGSFPLFPLIFNPDDEVFWGVPDSQIWEPLQLEANEIRTQVMKHRRFALVKILAAKGVLSEDEIAKMMSEDVASVIELEGVSPNNITGAVEKMTMADIPQSLIVASNEVRSDFREVVGFSRNQMGEFQTRRGDTSATEARAVEEASQIRVDERRDAVADVLVQIVDKINRVILERWNSDIVVDVVGPGGAQTWVRFNPSSIGKGHFNVKVDPDSIAPKTRDTREAKAARLYEMLKTNPLIDPQKLTQFLLTEIEGVELDDLMRTLPEQQEILQGNSQQSPVDIRQYAQGVGESDATETEGGVMPMPGSAMPNGYRGSTDSLLRILEVLLANQDKDFARRALYPRESPSIPYGDGRASHLMSSASDDRGAFAYPNIVSNPMRREGLELLDAPVAAKYASESGQNIRFGSDREADEFAQFYKDLWAMLKDRR